MVRRISPKGRQRVLRGPGLLCACMLSCGLLLGAGCAAPAAPQPPTLNLPDPVRDLSAQRSGDHVALSWTMPARTTDKLPLKGAVTAQLCRREGSGPCDMLPQQRFAPDAPASYDDPLPQHLASGGSRLLTYTVALTNHAGKSAGASNVAFVAGGSAPPVIQRLQAEVRNEGVVLSWEPPAASAMDVPWAVRIQRTRVSAPAPNTVRSSIRPEKRASARSAEEREQVLLVKGDGRAGSQQALDRTAVFGETYRYVAERQEEADLDGHALLTWGAPSQPVTVEVKDIFPPAAPADLAAVADTEAHAIDLSWEPDTEADLAGYVVYRRLAGAAEAPQRISPAGAPVQTPAFRDSDAQPGERYVYSVAAVDVRGNESQRSAEAEESLPR